MNSIACVPALKRLRTLAIGVDITPENAIHMLCTRLLGFTRELFGDSPTLDAETAKAMAQQLGPTSTCRRDGAGATHDGGLRGCDTNFEFELALDVILDGLERLRQLAR